MAYPATNFKKRQADGERLTGISVQEESTNTMIHWPERAVYGIIGVLLLLVLVRITLRLAGIEDTAFNALIGGLTDPYIWVFNSLFSSTPRLLLTAVEPGSIVSLIFFPFLGWALVGLMQEIRNGKQYYASRSRYQRQ